MLVREFGQVHGRAYGQGVTGGDRDVEALVAQCGAGQPVRRGHRPAQSDVEVSGQESVGQLVRVALVDVGGQSGVDGIHLPQQRDDLLPGDGRGVAEAQHFLLAAADAAGALESGACRATQDAGVLDQGGAGGQQRHAGGGALQQGYAHFAFQDADGGGERLLGQVQTGGGAGDAAFFGHRDQVLQFVQVQAHLG
ncbi:hypothetical protein GCM10020256_03830 [Streptomyces thermocoprophilus]